MHRTVTLLLALTIAISASPIVRSQGVAVTHVPLLPMVFFEEGSAEIPERYRFLGSTADFDERVLGGDPLEHHRDVLNVIGARMRAHSEARITLVGSNSQQAELGETGEVSQRRAETVRNYLVLGWGIDAERIAVRANAGFPRQRSNPKDPLGNVENRRVDIESDSWEIMRPVVSGASDDGDAATTSTTVWLIRFTFDSPEPGPLNERIIAEHLIPAIGDAHRLRITGYGESPGDRSIRLESQRAEVVARILQTRAGVERSRMTVSGISHEPPLETDRPEGRFHARSVVVVIEPAG